MERVICSTSMKEVLRFHDNIQLLDVLFSWTLEDVFNEDFYKNEVEKIPESFQSVTRYLSSYVFPLLEETRAELCSSMEVISQAPFGEVTSLDESKPYGSSLYDIEIDSWRNSSGARRKEPYKPKPGDIFVLADAVPDTVSDLQRYGRTWIFAAVTRVAENEHLSDDINAPTRFKVKTSKAIEIEDGMRTSLFAVFLINITTNKRIWTALRGLGNFKILKEVLCPDVLVQELRNPCSFDDTEFEKLGLRFSSVLNESQVTAVVSCISSVNQHHMSTIKLIWGPPGTGKTKTVSMLLWSLLKMKCRTLACAPTNVAITELAARVLKLVKESCSSESGKEMSICSLGDLLLFGNNDRLKVDGDLEEVFLDYRVDKLVECFAPLTGWKHRFTSMIDFLKDCFKEYQIFLENEATMDSDAGKENETRRVCATSFLEFTRKRFNSCAYPLHRCIQILCTHIPVGFMSQYTFQSMISLSRLLEHFENILSQDMVEKELEGIFAHAVEENGTLSFKDTCCCTRCECIFVLKSLRDGLDDLHLPNSMNKHIVREFCFRSASLICCTASSSYTLHSVVMEPLNFVVIDEAAQLKECESAIPLQLKDVKHAFLIGDECQLPAMVTSKISEEAGFGRSLFERLSSVGYPKLLLNIQYRMHPKISSFPNSKFYSRNIVDAANVQNSGYEKSYLPGRMFGPYSFISIFHGKEELDDISHSRKNLVEVAVTMKIVRNLFKAWERSRERISIGIVSPYSAQVAAFQEKLGHKYENTEGFVVRVKSIDGFQGGEEDIILISTVRSNRGGSIGFLSNPQRTNVALTRAKHCLWILGNGHTLLNSDSVWFDLIIDAKRRECFFNADEDKDLAKAILEAKKELDQLDDLLNGDSVLFKTSRWKVLFSDNFRKSFGNLKSSQLKKSILNLLLKLSSGWRPKKKNVGFIGENSSQLVKQFKVEGLYLISSVDIVYQSMHTQVLRIWDVLPLEEIPKLFKRLESIFGMYTDEFISHCKVKHIEGDLEVPVTWGTLDVVRYKDNCRIDAETTDKSNGTFDGRSYVENSKVSESLLLMKFYSLSSGVVGHLLSGQDGRELDLPFELTDQEQEIILFPSSTFILGRSGTGKTTVLTMKIIQKEQQHCIATAGLNEFKTETTNYSQKSDFKENPEDRKGTVLRQIFVTVSPKLCVLVKNHITHLKSFTCGSSKSAESVSLDMLDIDETVEFKDIPDCFMDIAPKSYPLVITFHKFLMMLDGSMEGSYFERFRDVRELTLGKGEISRSTVLQSFIKSKEVKYDRFNSSYWPHFNNQLTKKLDSSIVFTEIISHIKGGLKVGEVRDGKLSREDYIHLSEGRVSTLSREKREIIYDIFLDYEKRKAKNGDFDLGDFVMDLHRRLRDGCYKGEEMDFVYIDEVQDLTMRQIALFRYICRNTNDGFVFSGDTAQTIARGIDFRFQDIRSLFYKEFLLGCQIDGENKMKKDQKRISDIFHLNQNFRTHAGVLNLSQSVIDLLYRYFPVSVDILSPETSLIYGEAPVLLESGNEENAIVTIFGNAGNQKGGITGFGAEQVILVRDDCARNEITAYVGKQALVLTIVECKGLEFQDVLLYNFFGTSPLKNKWRVIYEYMKEQDLLDPNTQRSFQSFDKAKHNVLCSELKQLYVAITRTRQRLWICENMEEFSRPMFDYWKKLCLVQVRQLDDSLAKAMQVASSKDEWSKRGIKLFNEGNYEMATMCFERAGDSYREKWARAAGLRASADRMYGSNSEHARIALVEAAEIFETIGKAELAAKCFIQLKEFKRAGMLYLEKCGESRLEEAGECFTWAKCWSLAAETFAKGNCAVKCLSACTTGGLFDMALNFIKGWKGNSGATGNLIDKNRNLEEMEQKVLEKGAIHYHGLNDAKNMMKFVRAFNSMDTIRSFLRSNDHLKELLLLEEESGNFTEAASIARMIGNILLEADMLAKGEHFEEASNLIMSYVFGNSLWTNGSKGWPLKQFSDKEELITKAKTLAKNVSDLFSESISLEANLLRNQESGLLHMAKCLIDSARLDNHRAEVISVRNVLDAHLQLQPPKYDWEHEVVSNTTKHCQESILRNRASVESLVYYWNLWRGKVSKILDFLHAIGTQHEDEYLSYGEFCFTYLGVRKMNTMYSIFLLGGTDAHWMQEISDTSFQRSGDLVCVNAHRLAEAAKRYWISDILSVGMEVIETLEALHKLSVKKPLSIFCQGMVVLHMFDVAKYISNFNDWKYQSWALPKLRNFLTLSRGHFFEIVFPLDFRNAMAENMISLRRINRYSDLLEAVVVDNINSKSNLTYGQIGRVVMLLYVSGKLSDELYEKIVKCFPAKYPWQVFLVQLKDHLLLRSGYVALVDKLKVALQDTYNANWRKEYDYISPHCFVYLIECLLFLVSSCKKNFFTTKSSLIESLDFVAWEKKSRNTVPDVQVALIQYYEFIIDIVSQFLFNKKDTREWLEKSRINVKEYYPLLVLRLVTAVSLVFLNSSWGFDLLSTLSGRNDVMCQLPKAFSDVLRRRTSPNFANMLIEVFGTIGNPVVIVKSDRDFPQVYCPGALVVDMNTIHSRDDIVRLLFPENAESAGVQVDSVEIDKSSSITQNPSLNSAEEVNNVDHSPEFQLREKKNLNTENDSKVEALDAAEICNHIWNTLNTLKLWTSVKYADRKRIKLDAETSIDVLYTVITQLNQVSFCGDEDVSVADDVKIMIDELKKLWNSLSVSGEEPESYTPTVENLCHTLLTRRDGLQEKLLLLIDSVESSFQQKATDNLENSSKAKVTSVTQNNDNKQKEERNKKKDNRKPKKGKKKGKTKK